MWGAQARVLRLAWRWPAAWVSRVSRGGGWGCWGQRGPEPGGGGLSTHSAVCGRQLRAQCAWRPGPGAGRVKRPRPFEAPPLPQAALLASTPTLHFSWVL